MILNSFFPDLELRWVNIYNVVCGTLMSTGSHRNQVPHFILPLITRCPALFSHILSRFLPVVTFASRTPAFYP